MTLSEKYIRTYIQQFCSNYFISGPYYKRSQNNQQRVGLCYTIINMDIECRISVSMTENRNAERNTEMYFCWWACATIRPSISICSVWCKACDPGKLGDPHFSWPTSESSNTLTQRRAEVAWRWPAVELTCCIHWRRTPLRFFDQTVHTLAGIW